MKPGEYPHRFTAGDDYEVTIVIKQDGDPIDTQGFTFTAEIREGYLPHGKLIDAFTVTPVAGGARLNLTAAQTAAMAGRRLVWDLQSASPIVRTWLTGSVNVGPEVTQ